MVEPLDQQDLQSMHHVAICVDDVARSVEWYTERFQCRVKYQDQTWALIEFSNIHLALVGQHQHPPHIGFIHPRAEDYGPLKQHRDGMRYVYLQDPSGNTVEMLAEAGQTRPC